MTGPCDVLHPELTLRCQNNRGHGGAHRFAVEWWPTKADHADYCPVNCQGGCDDCLGQLGCTCRPENAESCHQDEFGECNWRECPAEDVGPCPLRRKKAEPECACIGAYLCPVHANAHREKADEAGR